MTIKLEWWRDQRGYRLRIFVGPDTRKRKYSGDFTLGLDEAVTLRAALLLGWPQVASGSIHESGWLEPSTAAP